MLGLKLYNDTRFKWSLDTAFLLMSLLAVAYLAMIIVLVLHLPSNLITLSAAALLLGSGLWFYLKQRISPIAWIISALVTAAGIVVSLLIYDTSYDGQVYHALAVLQLHEGWNPFYDPSFATSPWVRHYPKAPWMIGNFFYTYFPYLDIAKITNFISLSASFFAAFAVLGNIFKKRAAGLLAFVALGIACNPVVLAQLFTNYNDGLVGSLLVTYIAMLLMYAITSERKSMIIAAVSLLILVNIKFTAVAYVGIISIGFFLFLLRQNPAKLLRSFTILFLVGVFSVLAIGYNPYVSNTISKGHPFYPLAGQGKMDIMTANSPADFIGKNRFEKFARSITGVTGDALTPQQSSRKKLFSVDINEFKKINVDTRVSGFGPFSTWMIVLSGLVWLSLLIWDRRKALYGSLFVVVVLISVFINSESWWARYVPQLWIIPFVLVLCGLFSSRFVPRSTAVILLIVMTVTAGGAGSAVIRQQVAQSNEMHQQLEALAGKPITISGGQFFAIPARLQEKGITFTRVKADACTNPVRIKYSDMQVCTP